MEKTISNYEKEKTIIHNYKMEGKQTIIQTTNKELIKIFEKYIKIKYQGDFLKFLTEIVNNIGGTIISEEKLKINGLKSYTIIIQESHAQLIIDENNNEIYIDIFTCGDANPFLFSNIIKHIKNKKNYKNIKILELLRGENFNTQQYMSFERNKANHIILDVKNIKNIEILKNEEKLKNTLLKILDFIPSKITPSIDSHQFEINGEKGGISITIDLGDGLIAIHTYPEYGGFMLDVRSKKLHNKILNQIYDYIKQSFNFDFENIVQYHLTKF